MMSLMPAFQSHNTNILNQRILSDMCSSSIPSGRYSHELISLAKKLIDVDPNRRPDIIQIMNMDIVKMRLEGSGLSKNDFSDYSVIRGFQIVIYPPSRVNDGMSYKKIKRNIGY